MFKLPLQLMAVAVTFLTVVFAFPHLAHAADGDDYSQSTDYYINQRRFGGTEQTSTSADYIIQGMLGEPGVGESSSADYVYDSGTIWRTVGALAIDIVDSSYVSVVSPSVSMGNVTFSFLSQTATGTLGSDSQRVYWENLDAADTSGYAVTIAATTGPTGIWDATGATDYDFNDSSGATDGGDADSFGGQLTIDPSVGSLTARPGYGTTTGISLGGSTAFSEGVTDSITIASATGASDDYHAVYAKDMSLSQAIPASQLANTYTISMTLTIA